MITEWGRGWREDSREGGGVRSGWVEGWNEEWVHGGEVELGVGWGRLECMRRGWAGDEARSGWERGEVKGGQNYPLTYLSHCE